MNLVLYCFFAHCGVERNYLGIGLVCWLELKFVDQIHTFVDLLTASRLLPDQVKRFEIVNVSFEVRSTDLVITNEITALSRF